MYSYGIEQTVFHYPYGYLCFYGYFSLISYIVHLPLALSFSWLVCPAHCLLPLTNQVVFFSCCCSICFLLSEADHLLVSAVGKGKNPLNYGEDDNRKAPGDNASFLKCHKDHLLKNTGP